LVYTNFLGLFKSRNCKRKFRFSFVLQELKNWESDAERMEKIGEEED
jgi:hypothetical protein